MAPTIWIFADADDSLFTSVRQSPAPGSTAVAFDGKGPTGWLTPKQQQFLSLVEGRAQVVITTARTSKAAVTIQLPEKGYIICSFGGVIRMPDGQVEPRWHALIKEQAGSYAASLHELDALIGATCAVEQIDARHNIATDEGLELFLSIKHNKKDMTQMARLRDVLKAALPEGWRLHFNGNFLAALPAYLNKESAVRWFRANIAGEESLAIGFGDSFTDLSFMGECDLAIMPSKSQNFTALTQEVSHD